MRSKVTGRFHITPAEKKLLFLFLYYTVFAAIMLAYFGVSVGNQDRFIAAVGEYFSCESRGRDPASPPCPRDYERYTFPGLAAATYLLMGLVPVANLVYVIHFRELRQGARRVRAATVGSLSRRPSEAVDGGATHATVNGHTLGHCSSREGNLSASVSHSLDV